MRTGTKLTVTLFGLGLVLALASTTGCARFGSGGESPAVTSQMAVSTSSEPTPKSDGALVGGSVTAPESSDAAGQTGRTAQEPLVISTAGMSLEVKNLDAAVAAVRGLATKYGATIANLSTSAGEEPIPVPQPLDDSTARYAEPTPGGASITLRIPADKLAAAEREIAGLGRLVSQTSSQEDATQQHVDMKARLRNLQAEEARLRTFFLKATRVSEMLAIEQELARVRGEIESMQAQVAYLENQAALATLTVTLAEPGAVVSPAGGGWGFLAAIRDGVRSAAAVVRSMITVLIALSPVILLGVLLYLAVRALVLRRRNRRSSERGPQDDSGTAAIEPTQLPSTDSDSN